MDDKQMIYNGVDVSGCNYYKNNGKCRIPHYQQGIKYTCCNCNEWNCYYKQLKYKEQEYEELRQYHNKCCKENVKKLKELLEKYNQVSRDFYNGKYCNKENCSLLKAKEQEYERIEE